MTLSNGRDDLPMERKLVSFINLGYICFGDNPGFRLMTTAKTRTTQTEHRWAVCGTTWEVVGGKKAYER